MVTRNHVFTTDNDGSQEDGNPSSRSCPNKQLRLNENNDTKGHNKQDRILTKDVPESFTENIIVYDEPFSLSKIIESIVHVRIVLVEKKKELYQNPCYQPTYNDCG